jgi:hypothetical protein
MLVFDYLSSAAVACVAPILHRQRSLARYAIGTSNISNQISPVPGAGTFWLYFSLDRHCALGVAHCRPVYLPPAVNLAPFIFFTD